MYRLKATFDFSMLDEFYEKLTSQEFSREIIQAMKEAKITEGDTIEWYQNSKDISVYENYLEDIEFKEVPTKIDDINGNSFWMLLMGN